MKHTINVLVFCFLFSPLCFADDVPPYALFVENNHWIYEAMHILSVESRQTTLADRQPMSKGELLRYFGGLKTEKVPEASGTLYSTVQDYFSAHPFLVNKKYLRFDVNGIFALQSQYVYHPENEVRIDDFIRYNRTPAAVSVPIQLMFTPYVNFFGDIIVKKNYWASKLSYPYLNIPLTAAAFDMSFPIRAGLSIGTSFCNFTVGRGALNIGRSLSGSMLLADTADRVDYMSASFFHKNVRLALTVMELEPTRFVFSHEAAFRPIDWLTIRLYEGAVLNTPFDPRYLNPMMIFHNYFGWDDTYFDKSKAGSASSSKGKSRVGSQLGVSVDLVPVRGLRLYGQYGQNQFQTAFERNNFSGAKNVPNSLGGLCGIEYIHPFAIGHFSVTGEFFYANPWMYIMENKFISLYHRRRDPVTVSGKSGDGIMTWLANPYGPDTLGGIVQFSLIEPKKYRAQFRYRFLAKGENEEKFFDPAYERSGEPHIYYPPSDRYDPITDAKTPSGYPTYFHTLSIEGSYAVLRNLELGAGMHWTVAHGKKHGHALDCYATVKYAVW